MMTRSFISEQNQYERTSISEKMIKQCLILLKELLLRAKWNQRRREKRQNAVSSVSYYYYYFIILINSY